MEGTALEQVARPLNSVIDFIIAMPIIWFLGIFIFVLFLFLIWLMLQMEV